MKVIDEQADDDFGGETGKRVAEGDAAGEEATVMEPADAEHKRLTNWRADLVY